MNHADPRKVAVLVLTLFLGALPAGCYSEEERVPVDLRVDDSPVERQTTTTIHSYSEMLRNVHPTVVSIFAERRLSESGLDEHPSLREFFRDDLEREYIQSGVGSGVIVASQGFIVTNNHVIEDAERILVQLFDREELLAEIVGRDPATDIAVLRIRVGWDLEPAVLANSDEVEVGDVVFAFGNALGIGHAVTSGIISARGRTGIGILGDGGYEDFLQTDASMNVGNSGGPLVDSRGRVIGINTAIASPGGGNVGVGFAIPINMVREVMVSLIESGEVQRGYLGVTLRDPERAPVEEYGSRNGNGGVFVVSVVDGSPASQAGLEEGDLLVSLNGEPVQTASDLRLQVSRLKPGTEVAFDVVREGMDLHVPVVLGQLHYEEPVEEVENATMELLPGIRVASLTDDLRERMGVSPDLDGVLVTHVSEDSPHADLFPVGALILEINRESVDDLESARMALNDDKNLFLLLHEGGFRYLMVDVSKQ